MVNIQLPKAVIDLIADVMVIGHEMDMASDTLALVRLAKQVVTKPMSSLAIAETHQLLYAGDLRGARHLLEEADNLFPKDAVIKAMLASILYTQRDALWEAYANEVEALPENEQAKEIMKAIDKRVHKRFDAVEDKEEAENSISAVLPSEILQHMGRAC